MGVDAPVLQAEDCVESRDVELAGGDVQLPEPYTIELTGTGYRWRVRYPGVDGLLATEDDVIRFRNVHMPLDVDVQFVLKSTDYVYGIELPDFKKREIAVPDLEFRFALHAAIAGTFDLNGDEFCGDPHPELVGKMIVEPRDQFRRWLARQAREVAAESESPSQSDARRLR